MKYFKNENNELYAFEADGSQDAYITDNLIPIKDEEADAIRKSLLVTVTPSLVSMRQARLALLQYGLLSTVNEAINAGGDADKIAWEYAADVDRNSPLVQNMKAGLKLTDADLDNLFTLAASL